MHQGKHWPEHAAAPHQNPPVSQALNELVQEVLWAEQGAAACETRALDCSGCVESQGRVSAQHSTEQNGS